MGHWLSSLGKDKSARILILGLDNAGKTTLLQRLDVGEPYTVIPNIGLNIETVEYKSVTFQAWDLYEFKNRVYFPNTNGLIYVVDSSDHARLSEAQAELNTLLSEQDLQGVPLVLFCNKQDVGGALKPEEISQRFGLADRVGGRQWTVKGCCAHKKEGLDDGLNWLVDAITES